MNSGVRKAPFRPRRLNKELAEFLRARRENLSPEQVGLARQGRRRTPGLRREEVALLADIGVDWYSKLEMGHDIKTSSAALLRITQALQLNEVETGYVFVLAGIAMPRPSGLLQNGVPEAAEILIPNISKVAAVLWDRYMTAIRWNALADAIFGFADCEEPLDRNAILRLNRDAFRAPYYGSDYEALVKSLVGIFRNAYMTAEPTPFARTVYEKSKEFPLFKKFWAQQSVAQDLFEGNSGPLERHHAIVGSYRIFAANLQVFRREDLHLRIIAPADADSTEKFVMLEALGTPSTRVTRMP